MPLVVRPCLLCQVDHGEASITCDRGYPSDEAPVFIGESTYLIVSKSDFPGDIRTYQNIHGRVVRRTRIKRTPEVAQHVVALEVGEDVHRIRGDGRLVQRLEMVWLPLVVTVEPCQPACLHLVQQGLPLWSSATSVDVVQDKDRLRLEGLCTD